MGGALALLLGLELFRAGAAGDLLPPGGGSGSVAVEVVTFGAPQVGDADFAALVQALASSSSSSSSSSPSPSWTFSATRVVLRSDPVPRLLSGHNGLT